MTDPLITGQHRRFEEIERRMAKPRIGTVVAPDPLEISVGNSTGTFSNVQAISGIPLLVDDVVFFVMYGNTGVVLGKLQGPPVIRATITGTASLPGEAVFGASQKITINTVAKDTAGWWSAGLARYIPQLAGSYAATGYFHGTAAGTAGQTFWELGINKSGANQAMQRIPLSSTYGPEINVMTAVECNGTTDYIELWGGVGNAAGAGTAITGTERLDIWYIGP